MTVIDLGYADDDPAPEPARLFERRQLRHLAPVAVLLLCLSTLTMSVIPQPRGLRTVWSLNDVGGAYATVVGDSLVALDRDDSRQVSSYALADGRLQWTHRMSAPVPYLDAPRDAKVLLIPTGEITVPTAEGELTYFAGTVALDPATGAERWRSEGVSQGWVAADVALLQRFAPAGDQVVELIAVRIRDGARLWERDLDGVGQVVPLNARPADADRVAVVAGNEVTILRLADGTQVAAGTVDAGSGDPDGHYGSLVYADADAIYVLKTTAISVTATAHAADTLRRLWSFELSDGGGSMYPCGPVLCVGRSAELDGYDWTTGRLVWRAADMVEGNLTGTGLLVVRKPSGFSLALDPATGRTVAELGSGEPLYGGDMLATLTPVFDLPGREVVTVFDSRTGEGFALGTIAAGFDWNCPAVDRLIVCTNPQGTTTVTTLG